jgi:predicted hotdog family 3-hydroxylacyl-ACP dehydratase
VEYIAQSVSAFNCWRERQETPDAPPRVGFLLGSRQVTLPEPWFPEGAVLTITVREVFQDGQMGVYEGTLTRPGMLSLTTNINVYLPDPDTVGFPGPDSPGKELP